MWSAAYRPVPDVLFAETNVDQTLFASHLFIRLPCACDSWKKTKKKSSRSRCASPSLPLQCLPFPARMRADPLELRGRADVSIALSRRPLATPPSCRGYPLAPCTRILIPAAAARPRARPLETDHLCPWRSDRSPPSPVIAREASSIGRPRVTSFTIKYYVSPLKRPLTLRAKNPTSLSSRLSVCSQFHFSA